MRAAQARSRKLKIASTWPTRCRCQCRAGGGGRARCAKVATAAALDPHFPAHLLRRADLRLSWRWAGAACPHQVAAVVGLGLPQDGRSGAGRRWRGEPAEARRRSPTLPPVDLTVSIEPAGTHRQADSAPGRSRRPLRTPPARQERASRRARSKSGFYTTRTRSPRSSAIKSP